MTHCSAPVCFKSLTKQPTSLLCLFFMSTGHKRNDYVNTNLVPAMFWCMHSQIMHTLQSALTFFTVIRIINCLPAGEIYRPKITQQLRTVEYPYSSNIRNLFAHHGALPKSIFISKMLSDLKSPMPTKRTR